MKPEHAARRAIIRDWMALPREQRQSVEQAAAFVTRAAAARDFPCAGSRPARILTWLRPRIGRP